MECCARSTCLSAGPGENNARAKGFCIFPTLTPRHAVRYFPSPDGFFVVLSFVAEVLIDNPIHYLSCHPGHMALS